MINATAINAVPVLEDVHVGTTQEWSLRLKPPGVELAARFDSTRETHQVLTHSKD